MWRILALILLVLVVSCARGEIPSTGKLPSEVKSEARPSDVEMKAPWELDWDKTIAEGRKEGKLVVYSSAGAETRIGLVEAFRTKYKVDVDFITGKGVEVIAKIMTERKAGIYTGDIYIGGNTPMLETLQPAQAFEPVEPALILPEVKDAKNWLDGELYFVDSQREILQFAAYPMPILAINTQLVRAEELASYRDLLLPKWKGKIILNNPTLPGLGAKWFQAEIRRIGLDFMKELARQEPIIITDQRLQVEWLAHGKYPVLIGPKSDPFAEFFKAGASIRVIDPKEGGILTSGSGNVSLFSKAPHLQAARLFLNWLLSRDGQLAFSQATLVHSGRVDVPSDFLPPGKARDPKVKYFNVEKEEILRQSQRDYALAREVFGHLMK